MDVTFENGVVTIQQDGSLSTAPALFKSYPVSRLNYYEFTSREFVLNIGDDIHKCAFADLSINGDNDIYDFAEANDLLNAGFNPFGTVSGISGTFTSDDLKTITVENGIITNIEDAS